MNCVFLVFIFLLICALSFVGGIKRQPDVDAFLRYERLLLEEGYSLKLSFDPTSPAFLAGMDFSVRAQNQQVVRKEYRCLNNRERQQFHQAFKKLHVRNPDITEGRSKYDIFVGQHDSDASPAAHYGPAFLCWHREYLYRLEKELQTSCPTCGMVYFDSRLESRMGGNPQNSVLFTPELAGDAVGPVITGFAANWSAINECSGIHPTVYRNFNENTDSLYSDAIVNTSESTIRHEDVSFGWNSGFEIAHGYVHTSFGPGSHMTSLLCSPTDPMFFMHHCFVDNLFERIRNNIKKNNPPLRYANINDGSGSARPNHDGDAEMAPFAGKVNKQGILDEAYTTKYYRYEESPGDKRGCTRDSQCCGNGYSRFLWCNRRVGLCMNKVVEGTQIDPSEFTARACYCGRRQRPSIVRGECKCSDRRRG